MHKVSIKEGVDLLTFDTRATASNLNRTPGICSEPLSARRLPT